MVYTDGIHLISDVEEELHEFASKIGLKREWYQDHPRHPHYDLTTKRKANQAVKSGAKQITTRDVVRIFKGE